MYSPSPRKRSKTCTEPKSTQTEDYVKVIPIHHLLEPKVDPLQFERFRKIRQTNFQFNLPSAMQKQVKSPEFKDQWKHNTSHHFVFRQMKTQTTRESQSVQQYRPITDNQLTKLKSIMRKIEREQQENSILLWSNNKTLKTSPKKSDLKNEERKKLKLLRDLQIQKLKILKENTKKNRLANQTQFFSKFVRSRYKNKKNDIDSSLISSKQKNQTRSSFNVTLSGWITDNHADF